MLLSKISRSTAILPQCRHLSNRAINPKQFTSILSDVPPRPRSGWQIFVRERLPSFKDTDGKIPTTKVTKVLSEEWKQLGDAQKKTYSEKYEHEAKRHDDAVIKALARATPQQIHNENILRRKHNLTLLKDPKQPKRPLNGYMLFLDHLRKNGPTDFKSFPVAQQAHEGAKMYKALDPQEKKKYDELAKKNHAVYLTALTQYKELVK